MRPDKVPNDLSDLIAVTSADIGKILRVRADGKGFDLATEFATTAEVQAGTDDAHGITPADLRAGFAVYLTPIATTSGTSHDFTGIPSWARNILLMWDGVSTNGTSDIIVQLGDAGGFENTGYSGAAWTYQGATVGNFSAGFILDPAATAASINHGQMQIILMDPATHTWTETSISGRSDVAAGRLGAGSKSLSEALTGLRLTTAGGVNTFDAGKINCMYW